MLPLDSSFGKLLAASGEHAQIAADLDEALTRLAEFAPRQAKIVELRFFAGLTEEQIAEMLSISDRTVKRDWTAAKAWLYGEIAK